MSTTAIRTIRILKFLSLCEYPVSIGEISRHLNEDRNAIRRCVTSLCEESLIHNIPHTYTYEMSASVTKLSQKFYENSDTQKMIDEYLDLINQETAELCTYDIMESNQVVILKFNHNKKHEDIELDIGDKIPGHCSSAGRIIAANNFQKAVPLISESLNYLTEKTITDQFVFIEQLQNSQDQGFAFCDQEWIEGISCVGSAIQNRSGVFDAGISIGGSANRFTPSYAKDLGGYVKEKCEEISNKIKSYKT